MRYDLKPMQELYWSALTAAAVVLLLELASLNPDGITSWRTWGVALGVSMLRSGAGAALDWVRRHMMSQPPAEAPAPVAPSVDMADLAAMMADWRKRQDQRERLKAGAEAEKQKPVFVSFGSGQIEGKG